jgi:hypothetical protein
MLKDILKEVLKELLTPQTIFALMFYLTYLKRVWLGEPVPEGLAQIVNMILAFYYGMKAGRTIAKKENNNEQKN